MTDQPTRDRELFYRVAEQIEREPMSYNQDTWGRPEPNTPCGTARCIAGWAVYLRGYKPYNYFWSKVTHPDHPDRVECIREAAQRELGLTVSETLMLFHEHWRPRADLTVPEALRMIGDGVSVEEVSR